MIYFDNAATTYPKPPCVRAAMLRALDQFGGNPGRGGHRLAMAASEEVYRCREAVASLFHLENPANVIFTLNCTMSLNMVIKGLLRNGGRAVVSDLEHNAVMRPLHGLSRYPVYDVAQTFPGDDDRTVEAFRRCITPATRLLVCTHASNVFGVALPIRRIGELCRRFRIPFVVDGAQSAGLLPIDMERDNIDFLCLPGHKGLYGPMGTGLLLCSGRYDLPPFVEGGTGSQSLQFRQPGELPDKLESGTPNTPGICGLRAGVEFVSQVGIDAIAQRECAHMAVLYDRLQSSPRITLYTPPPRAGACAPVLSVNVQGYSSEEAAAWLSRQGVAVRAGLHCAPAAHRKFGTLPSGTVRLAPSVFTTRQQTEELCKILLNLPKK